MRPRANSARLCDRLRPRIICPQIHCMHILCPELALRYTGYFAVAVRSPPQWGHHQNCAPIILFKRTWVTNQRNLMRSVRINASAPVATKAILASNCPRPRLTALFEQFVAVKDFYKPVPKFSWPSARRTANYTPFSENRISGFASRLPLKNLQNIARIPMYRHF